MAYWRKKKKKKTNSHLKRFHFLFFIQYFCKRFEFYSMKSFFIHIFCFFFFLPPIGATSSGLYFKAHDYIKEERTSLDLTPEKKFHFHKGFDLSFDIKLREEFHNYGYIFRIIANDSICFDLIANFGELQRSLALVEGGSLYLPFQQDDLDKYQMETWSHVKFQYLPQENKIIISFNDITLTHEISANNMSNFQIVFGFCDYQNFKSADVPPMTIRNISIKDHLLKEKAYWPLREHHFNIVYDSIGNRKATALNPIWEIDQHTKWVKRNQFKGSGYMQMTYDEKNGILYFADKQFILCHHLRTNVTDTIHPVSGNVFYEKSNQIIYNPYYHQIWAYDFYKPHIIFYDFEQNCWSMSDTQIKNPTHSQHNAFISPIDSLLYTYGGYGTYTYKDDMLRKRKEDIDWEKVDYSPHIPARYLSGMGFKSPDTLLIFGGYGNPSGKQEMGPVNYYDLYAIDIKNFTTTHLWTLPKPEKDFAVSNAIIVNSQLNKFFALCFPNNRSNSHLILKSFDIKDGASEIIADTIPYIFNDVTSFCTLYLDKVTNVLYAVTKHSDSMESVVDIYSLAYPPLSIYAVNQSEPIQGKYQPWVIVAFGLVVVAAVISFIIWLLIRKKAGKKLYDTLPVPQQISSVTNTPNVIENEAPDLSRPSSINFLGGFQVINKHGADITGLFTPTIKHVLILIILYTVKNKKGASNVSFRDCLWPEKSDKSSQNNRRVNIMKLRVLLEDLDGITLTGDNLYWAVKADERFYCDYMQIYELMDLFKSTSTLEMKKVQEFFALSSRGQLLPYIQKEWCDIFKEEFSSEVLNVLIGLSNTPEIHENYKLLIRIADIMFVHDTTDEHALKLKCKALFYNGKSGLAKTTYTNFCDEYQTLLGISYPKNFQDIIYK